MKPKMKQGQFRHVITRPVEVTLDNDMDRFSNGWMMMAITECKILKNGKEHGSVRVDVGGSAVQALIHGRAWSIPMTQLWPLFEEADAKYKKGVKT